MISSTELKRHPVAILTYMAYIMLWIMFVRGAYVIRTRQVEEGLIRCGTPVMITLFMLLGLSALYFMISLLVAFFTRDRRFFLYLALGILVPVIGLLIWQLFR